MMMRMEIWTLMLAFLALLMLASIPLINLAVSPFVPVPLCAIYLRHGRKAGTLSVAAILLFLVVAAPGPQQIFALPFACAGALLGILSRPDRDALKTIAFGAAGLTLLMGGLFYGYNFHALNSDKVPTTEEFINQAFNPQRIIASLSTPPDSTAASAVDEAFVWMTGEQVSAEAAQSEGSHDYDRWLERTEQNRQMLLQINKFPIGIFFVGSGVYFSLFYLAAVWLLPRWNIHLPRVSGFRTWRIEWTASWLPILCFAAYALFRSSRHATGEFVSDSLLLISLVPYMLLAFSVAAFWIDKYRLDPLLAAIIYSFIVLNLKQMAVVAIFDSWMDFRRLDKENQPPKEDKKDESWYDDIEL